MRQLYTYPATAPKQWNGVAHSLDGIHFQALLELLGKFYFRVWQWQDLSTPWLKTTTKAGANFTWRRIPMARLRCVAIS